MSRARSTRILITALVGVAIAGGATARSAGPGSETKRTGPAVAYPGPGWRYVSPRSGITFRGVALSELSDLKVIGSRSGAHPGQLHALRIGVGTVYEHRVPFVRGERVWVSGVRVYGAQTTTFTFTVSQRARHSASKHRSQSHVYARRLHQSGQVAGGCRLHTRRFHTLPRLRPVPFCLVHARGARLPRGRILVTPTPAPVRLPGEQFGVMILSNGGKLLWYSPRPNRAHDAKTVMVGGRRLFVFYQKQPSAKGYYEFRDSHYRVVTRLFAGNGYNINAHDIDVTDRGTAFISAYERVLVPHVGTVADFVVQEIDLITHDVLFEWHALDHIRPAASYAHHAHGRGGWDYFHGNSIEPSPHGSTLVISARNTSAVYGINSVTGRVLWTLGGKHDRFRLHSRHPSWQFCAQHDARWMPNGDLTIFDNGGEALPAGSGCPEHPARVQQFRLDPAGRSVRLVRTISSTSMYHEGYFPGWVGGARYQPNGDMLISWGTTGQITEVSPTGRIVLRLRLGRWTYRAARAPWTGFPLGRPRIAARRDHGAVDVWASWNGATQIRSWRVLAGSTPTALKPAGRPVTFVDLETHLRTHATRYVAVQALNAHGNTLGESAAVGVRGGQP